MSTLLVTGGAGYIGSVLVPILLEAGYDVRVLDRMYFGQDALDGVADHPALTVVKDDIRTVDASVMEGVDAVLHLAAISSDPACDLIPTDAEAINNVATIRIAEMARDAGASRFVFSSSCSVYGTGVTDVVDEDSEMAPVSLYARTKIDAEAQLFKLGTDDFTVTSLRNATVYGLSPRMRFDLVINIMTLYAYTRRKIFVLGGGHQWRPIVHVRDVARAFIGVLEASPDLVSGQAFNVGSAEQNYQVLSMAQMVRDVVPNTDLEIVPDDPDRRDYNVSFAKAQDALGFVPEHSPYEGIVEIKQALERGVVQESPRTRNEAYMRYLLEAERLVRELSMNGSILSVED